MFKLKVQNQNKMSLSFSSNVEKHSCLIFHMCFKLDQDSQINWIQNAPSLARVLLLLFSRTFASSRTAISEVKQPLIGSEDNLVHCSFLISWSRNDIFVISRNITTQNWWWFFGLQFMKEKKMWIITKSISTMWLIIYERKHENVLHLIISYWESENLIKQ